MLQRGHGDRPTPPFGHLPLYGEVEPSGKTLALVTPLAIEANEGTEERLNVSLSRNEGRAVPCSTEVKERGWERRGSLSELHGARATSEDSE